MIFLTPAEVAQQQALAEGYQNGPTPTVNPANIFTQAQIGNPISPIAEPVPYYPPATYTTPLLGLSLQGLDVVMAENMVILDEASAFSLETGADFTGAVTFEAGVQFIGFMQVQGGLLDLSNSAGSPGQLLESTGSGVLWTNGTASFLSTSLLTTQGDTLYENATPAAARLAIGSTGQVLTVVAGLPAWATPSSGSASSLTLSVIPINTAAYAINPHTAATYIVLTAGVNTMTLAAPTVTTDDGKVIKVTLGTSAAHTITCTGGTMRCGTAAVTTINFASFYGSSVELMAYQGLWYVMAQNLVASYS